tara:strand:- start:965 stop:1339 length:375 start_codon:yes stop_codon:yes gene_type:complete
MEGIIYYIDCGNKDYYVGSTTIGLRIRTNKHRSKMKQYPNRKLYKTLIERSLPIELIEYKKVIYHSKKQLRFYEEQARKTLKATINEIKCFQTPDQRKEHKRLYMREYHKRKKLEKENKENNIS